MFNRNRVIAAPQTHALTDDAMRNLAPSIFADDPHSSRSDRYTYIPTIEVLNALRKEGFEPFNAMQTRVRTAGKRDHAKHLVRLRHVNHAGHDEANEIILINSHDGSSSYRMMSGVYRFVCANGMICGDTFDEIRVPHKGDIQDQVVEGAHLILDGFDLITEKCDVMKSIQLDQREQEVFARAALALKYGDNEGTAAPITESQILQPRRSADLKSDLWSTFNRVQENTIKGGITGRSANGKRTTTRGVTGIDQNSSLNRALWTLADEMARIKTNA